MSAPVNPRELKRACDFVALVSYYTKLRRAGSQYRSLCPFHSERNPSLYIEPQQRIWKCFGCERGGDLFDFVMLAEHCDFPSALRIVSDFVSGVATASERRSRERFGRSEGAKPLSAAQPRVPHSRNQRDSIVAALDATTARNQAIARVNAESFAEFERACEPDFLLEKTG
ncbi:MAG: CHC2 zinc finger domain-containing protein [Candidatus Acidiferrales bacterium]